LSLFYLFIKDHYYYYTKEEIKTKKRLLQRIRRAGNLYLNILKGETFPYNGLSLKKGLSLSTIELLLNFPKASNSI